MTTLTLHTIPLTDRVSLTTPEPLTPALHCKPFSEREVLR